jgi:7-keto-8-aminopelargonate synthetase-like enzyme
MLQSTCAQLLELGAVVLVLRSAIGERRLVSGIRITVTQSHTKEEIDQMIGLVEQALQKVMTKN